MDSKDSVKTSFNISEIIFPVIRNSGDISNKNNYISTDWHKIYYI